MKIRVPIAGTIGKSVLIDPDAGAQIGRNLRLPNGTVPTLDELIALLGGGSTRRHSTLTGLQVGNDHPQYPLSRARETILGQWDFAKQVWATDGDETAPGYAFTDDVTSGVFRAVSPGDPSFANVVVLLHADGANGGTTFTDSSSYARTVTAIGTAVTDTTTKKYGTAALAMPTAFAGHIEFADAPALRIATGNWTMEFWAFVTPGATFSVYKDDPSVIYPCQIIVDEGATLAFYATDAAGATIVNIGGLGNFPANQWVHIAAVRSGSTFYLFQDGVLQNTGAYGGTLGENSSPWKIGPSGGGAAYADDYRFTVGVARYTSNFTPPSAAFPGATGTVRLSFSADGDEKFAISADGEWLVGGTTPGTSGAYFKSGGSGAPPEWTAPAALTRTNDTNVTLTLGGSPTTALLNATSLTLGWTGTLAVTRGGTGLATVAQGDLLYSSATNTLARLAKNTTATRYLSNTGTSNNPAWAQVNLANGVTGTLPAANGGTAQSTYTTGDLLYASAANTLSKRAIGSTNDVLAVVGGVPTWSKAITPTWTGTHTWGTNAQVLVDVGTSSLPGLAFAGDADTGIYQSSADSFRFVSGGLIVFGAASNALTTFQQFRADLPGGSSGGSAATPAYSIAGNTNTGLFSGAANRLSMSSNAVEVLRVDDSATGADTRLLLWDVSAGALVRVSRGAADSGGVGFRVLRIPN